MKGRKCAWCGRSLNDRRDQHYCSVACRKNGSRRGAAQHKHEVVSAAGAVAISDRK